jgi:hypothetical protein
MMDYERIQGFHPNIIYNSDNLIISDTYVFSKPHIVLTKDVGSSTGVNYGFVDFRELEMQADVGAYRFQMSCKTSNQ